MYERFGEKRSHFRSVSIFGRFSWRRYYSLGMCTL